jgi:acyl-coenzyme A thioesterase 13
MIYDICTSITLQAISKPGLFLNGGVSRVLSVSYLRPAPEGTELELEAEVVSAGKNLAMLRGVLRRASDGAAISTCEHNKVAVKAKPQWKM